MLINSSTDLTPKKQQPVVYKDQKKLEESLKKTSQSEINLKNRIQKMSYKMLSDCIFEIAINQPSSQPIIENYLNEQYIRDQSVPLKSLTQDFLQNKTNLEEEQKKLISMIPENQLQILDDLNQLKQFVQENNNLNLKDCLENLQNQSFRDVIEQLNIFVDQQIRQKVDKRTQLLQKQNERLEQKIDLREKNLKMNKHHLKEYLSEIEKMREKIISLEFTNQDLRNNFDNTIQNLEEKVDLQNQKKYGNQLDEFKNQLLEKERKIDEIKKTKEQKNLLQIQEQNSKKNFERQINDLSSKLQLKELKIISLQKQINDTENLMDIEKKNTEHIENQLQSLKQENEYLNQKLLNLNFQSFSQVEAQTLQSEIDKLKNDNEVLRTNEVQLVQQLDSAKKNLEKNLIQQEKLEQKIIEQNILIENKNQDLLKNKEKYNKVIQQNTQIQQEQNQLLQKLQIVQKTLQEQQTVIESKQQDLQTVYIECRNYQKQYEQSQQDIDQLKNALQQEKDSFKQLQLKLQNVYTNQEELQVKYNEVVKENQKYLIKENINLQNIKNIENQLSAMEKDIILKEQNLNSMKIQHQENTQIQEQIQVKLKTELQSLNDELQLINIQNKKNTDSFIFQKEEYVKKIDELNLEIQNIKKKNILQLQTLKDNYEQKLCDNQNLIQSYKNQNETEIKKHKLQQLEKQSIKTQYEQMQKEFNSLNKNYKLCIQQIDNLKIDQVKYDQLKSNYKDIQEQVKNQKTQQKNNEIKSAKKIKKIKKLNKIVQKRNQSKTKIIKCLNQKIQNNQIAYKTLSQQNQEFMEKVKKLLIEMDNQQEFSQKNIQQNIFQGLKKIANNLQENQSQQNKSTNFFSVQMRILKQEEIMKKFEQNLHEKLNTVVKLIKVDYENYSWKQKIQIIKKHLKKNINQVQQWLQLQQDMDVNGYYKKKRHCHEKINNQKFQ